MNISIHALLTESDRVTMDSHLEFIISIHALLTESDWVEGDRFFYYANISIHALLTESDHHLSTYRHQGQQFLSTLSLRRATGDRQRT